ncbi:hypothetical protein C8F01DRAFT_1254545 [Mycena amicta]|nr:hypothetical protein C8F01DRAFT_1254545 [Mycena amicta]
MANKTNNSKTATSNGSRARPSAQHAAPQPAVATQPVADDNSLQAAQNNKYLHMQEDSDNDLDADDDFAPPVQTERDEDDNDDIDNEDHVTSNDASGGTRGSAGRERRPSDKQQQLIDGARETAAQKKARQEKAARIANGELETREPIDDNFISTRIVDTARPKTINNLVQRASRAQQPQLTAAIPGARPSGGRHGNGHTASAPRPDHHHDTDTVSTPRQSPPTQSQPAPRRISPLPARHTTSNGHSQYPGRGRTINDDDLQYDQQTSSDLPNAYDNAFDHQNKAFERRRSDYDERGAYQPDARYSESGAARHLPVDPRFPGHGGVRLSGQSVEHEPQPHRQEQVRRTFRGMDPLPPSSPPGVRSPYTGERIGPFTLRLRSDQATDSSDDNRPPAATSRVNHKRKHQHLEDDADDDIEDDLRSLPEPRTTASGQRAKLALKDCDATDQEYMKHIIVGMRVRGSVWDIFPEQSTMVEWVLELRDKAEEDLGGKFDIKPQQIKLCCNRLSHLRGEAKTKLAPIVATTHFESGEHPSILKANNMTAHTLKMANAFIFKDYSNKTGMYGSGLIPKAVNAVWFANRRDEGPTFPEFFKPLPIPALAFMLTVIENCIDEWVTGTKTPIPFTANDYRSMYQGHVMSLKRFEQYTADYGILDNLRKSLYDNGRFHSGAQPIASSVVGQIDDDDILAAIKEFEDARDGNDD